MAAAMLFVSLPGPSSAAGSPSSPVLGLPWSLVIAGAVVLSAAWFPLSTVDLFRSPVLASGLVSFGVLAAGSVLIGSTVTVEVFPRSGGVGVLALEYPQPLHLAEWGALALATTPVVAFLHHRVRDTAPSLSA